MATELRSLKATDLFTIAGIIGKIGLKDFGSILKTDNDSDDVEEIGLEVGLNIAGVVAENLDKCEDQIFKFLASVSNQSVNNVKNLPPVEFFDLVIAVFSMPDFKDFFTRASQLFK